MIRELGLAWRYFFYPRESTPKVIPRAGTLGLALSITVLLTTLSVMNGFDIHIKEKVMSRLPHISSPTITADKKQELKKTLGPSVDKIGSFYQTRLLVPKWGYVQVHVFISEDFTEPMISSALINQFHWQKGQEVEFWGFTNRKILGKAYPQTFKMTFDKVRSDSIYGIYLPSSSIESLRTLSLQQITGIWLNDPFSAQAVKSQLQSAYPSDLFYSWVDQYSSLFDAVSAEKRLVGVVLSLLIILIFFQLNLTMILIFKDKQKDMVTLHCFLEGEKSVFWVFYSYALINIICGVIFGSLFGWLLSTYLPSIASSLEGLLSFEILPYNQYAFNTLPSFFMVSDLIYVSTFSLIAGAFCSYLLIRKLSRQPLLETLRQYQ